MPWSKRKLEERTGEHRHKFCSRNAATLDDETCYHADHAEPRVLFIMNNIDNKENKVQDVDREVT